MDGLGAYVADVAFNNDSIAHPTAAVENVVPIASYSWLDERTPTIAVPSSPSVWAERALPLQCKPDTAVQYINQNAFRCPDSPLTPLVESVRNWAPEFDFSTIDIVTDRNNLRKLIGWAQGSKDEFRIDLQRAGDGTVLFSRWQAKTREPPQRSYAHEFEKSMTRNQGGNPGENHHRIVTYDFAGLNLLVRFEVDACYPSTDDSGLDALIAKTTSLSLSTPSDQKNSTTLSTGIRIVRSNNDQLVDQKDLIELATRSFKNRDNFNWLQKYPQLYLSDTPHFILGVHEYGTFTRVEKFGTDDTSNAEVRKAREEMQPGLNKLGAVLAAIHSKVLDLTDDDATGSRRDRLLAVVYQDGKLSMYERKDGPKLPAELVQCF